MPDVIVYQMGKCASTSIVTGLCDAGIDAVQTHALGDRLLAQKLRNLTTRTVPDYGLDHGVAQLGINVRITQHILRDFEAGRRVRVITLARHPLDWFWSSVLQSFDAWKHEFVASETILAFEEAWTSGDLAPLSELHRVIVTAMVHVMNAGFRLTADALGHTAGSDLRERILAARELVDPRDRRTANLGFRLLSPATWFETYFEPLFGIDVLTRPLPVGGGARITDDRVDILVLKFERLADLQPMISDFVGRTVQLPRSNESRSKRYAGELAAARRLVHVPDSLVQLLWSSRYCRHFDYGPPAGSSSIGVPTAGTTAHERPPTERATVDLPRDKSSHACRPDAGRPEAATPDLDCDAEFIGRVTSRLEGWLTDDDAAVTADLLRLQEAWAGDAPLVEIGVYGGKYLTLLMHSAMRTGSHVFGIDTFQFKDLATVTEGLRALIPDLMPRLSLHPGSSRELTAESFLGMLGRPARFISIDGSHDYPDVLHDLRLADATLDPGGLVVVDDFLNPVALGVNRAVNAFMASMPDLVGVACGPNKLFLARPRQAEQYRRHLERHLLETSAARGQLFRERLATWRGLVEQDFFGSPLLLYAAG